MNPTDYTLPTQIEMAKAIIIKSLKSGKLLTEYRLWDKIDYIAKREAIFEMTCHFCRRIKPLTGTRSHYFGTESACIDCSDETNYPHLFKNGKRLPLWEVKTI